jgi:hypothetical protein
MKIIRKCKLNALLMVIMLGFSTYASAQLSMSAQIRPRAEYRNGVGTLKPKDITGNGDTAAAGFISQRSRLSLNYKFEKLAFGMSIQDVRVWGQDASTISNADGSRLSLHEAWAEAMLSDTLGLSLKLGRQELLYDDSRLLGNLDWLQQGRRHDAALLKLNRKGWQVDLGVAYNQNTDAFNTFNSFYTAGNTPQYITIKGAAVAIPAGFVPTASLGGAPTLAGGNPSTNGGTQMYKMMQYLYAAKKIGEVKVSGLFFKDDFGKFRSDSISAGTEKIYGRRYDVKGLNSRITAGILAVGTAKKVFSYSAGAFFQTGKDRDGKDLSAYHFTAYAAYTKGKYTVGLGYELLSGDEITTPTTESKRFDPLYGTPHKFWGLMDYFYVGTGSPAAGLSNPYLRLKYVASPKLTATLDVHSFSLANDAANKVIDATGKTLLGKNLGTEGDLILNYTMSKSIGFELGYCMMFANDNMEVIKRNTMGKANQTATWAYLSINLKPELISPSKK